MSHCCAGSRSIKYTIVLEVSAAKVTVKPAVWSRLASSRSSVRERPSPALGPLKSTSAFGCPRSLDQGPLGNAFVAPNQRMTNPLVCRRPDHVQERIHRWSTAGVMRTWKLPLRGLDRPLQAHAAFIVDRPGSGPRATARDPHRLTGPAFPGNGTSVSAGATGRMDIIASAPQPR